MLSCTTARFWTGPLTTPSSVATPVGVTAKSRPLRSSPALTVTAAASSTNVVPGKYVGASPTGRDGARGTALDGTPMRATLAGLFRCASDASNSIHLGGRARADGPCAREQLHGRRSRANEIVARQEAVDPIHTAVVGRANFDGACGPGPWFQRNGFNLHVGQGRAVLVGDDSCDHAASRHSHDDGRALSGGEDQRRSGATGADRTVGCRQIARPGRRHRDMSRGKLPEDKAPVVVRDRAQTGTHVPRERDYRTSHRSRTLVVAQDLTGDDGGPGRLGDRGRWRVALLRGRRDQGKDAGEGQERWGHTLGYGLRTPQIEVRRLVPVQRNLRG